MTDLPPPRPGFLRGLSARLLMFIISFVILAEAVIYLPSVARFRRIYLEDQIEKAHLAALALQANPSDLVTDPIAMDLLMHAGAHAIVLKVPERRMLMLSDRMPPELAAAFDLREQDWFDWLGDAIATLVQRENRVLRVIDNPRRDPEVTVEVVLDETPLRRAMWQFSWRTLQLSVLLLLVSAALVYVVLQLWMVRPILRLAESMVRFRDNPEDERTTITASRRGDEIGIAEVQLAAMQREVRTALRQKTRLAALGSAVAKIHHDLRNTLATAVLASDRLADIDDPDVQRLVPRLYQAIDRAVLLTSRTLDFLREGPAPLQESAFRLQDLLADVDEAVRPPGSAAPLLVTEDGTRTAEIVADRDQLFRVFSNLALNAQQAGARCIRVLPVPAGDRFALEVRDDGPGISEKVQEQLFLPFTSGHRTGGTGLGLVIAREIMAAHGGGLSLIETGEGGTAFRVELPGWRLKNASH